MAETVVQFSFNADLESWAATVNGASGLTMTRDTAEDSPNDPNAGAGTLQTRRSGKNLSNGSPFWEWVGTWEDLGVPAGAVVTGVNLAYDWRCSEFNVGHNQSRTGPAELRDSGETVRHTFSIDEAFTDTTDWATQGGTPATGLEDASDTSIRLRLGAYPRTGSNNAAAVTIRQDWIVVTVTYDEGGGADPDIFEHVATGGLELGGSADASLLEPGALVDTGLAVRYFVDEAGSGTDPTHVVDHGPGTPLNLAITYGTALSYSEVEGNRGLESTSTDGTQKADAAVNDTSDKVRDTVLGKTQATLEVVVDGQDFTANSSRIFGIIESDQTNTWTLQAQAADNWNVRVNNVNHGRYNLGTGRMVVHLVLDTSQPTADERVKMYKDGVLQTRTSTPSTLTENETLSTGAAQSVIAFNRVVGNDRAFVGVLYYAALYGDHAFSQAEIDQNVAILSEDDDRPVTEFEHAASGGLALSGAALVAATWTMVAAGGLALGGAADVALVSPYEGSGGVVLSGAAEVATATPVEGSGGLALGGAADVAAVWTVEGAGGAVLAGAADVATVSTLEATGGVALAGSAEAALFEPSAFAHEAEGGLVFAGAADVAAAHVIDGSGGVALAGAADVATVSVHTAAGGVALGGAADLAFEEPSTFEHDASGGVLVGGAAEVASVGHYTAVGGLALGGTADVALEEPGSFTHEASGGLIAGGEALVQTVAVVDAAGGVLVGGSADVALVEPGAFSHDADGGVELGGGADVSAVHVYEAAGGLAVGGQADAAPVTAHAAAGGVLVGGTAEIVRAWAVDAAGGVRIGGSADTALIQSLFEAEGSGGLVLGGSADSVSPVQVVFRLPIRPLVTTRLDRRVRTGQLNSLFKTEPL